MCNSCLSALGLDPAGGRIVCGYPQYVLADELAKSLHPEEVLHSELLRHRLRADSFEKCSRWRLSFSCDKARVRKRES